MIAKPVGQQLSRVLGLVALLGAPAPTLAADLKIDWEQGFYPEEDQAITAVVAAYQKDTGKTVELNLYPQDDFAAKIVPMIEAGNPPDVLMSLGIGYLPAWAQDDKVADLSDVVGPIEDQFYPGALTSVRLRNGRTGQSGYYAVPIGQFGHYIHVWKSLLEQAGIRMEDIPEQWDAFWAFWCDRVQPAVRRATGRNDFYGIGLPMSAKASDTATGLYQFQDAYGADLLSADGQPRLDDPAIRAKVVRVLADYTSIWAKGCTPPDSVNWTNIDNNKAFHDQRVAMTINSTLSITNALRAKRPDDYYHNTATIPWPKAPGGQPYGIETDFIDVVVFKDAKNVAGAKDFLRYLLSEGRLGGFLEASLGRGLPTMPALLETAFWQDPKDPHRAAAAKQLGQPVAPLYQNLNPKYGEVGEQAVWQTAVNRIAVDHLSPEQAADQAIAEVKQILAK